MAREDNESALGAKLRKERSEFGLPTTPRSSPFNSCDGHKQPPLIAKDELLGIDCELKVHEVSGHSRTSLAGGQLNSGV